MKRSPLKKFGVVRQRRAGKYGVARAADRVFEGQLYDSKLEMAYAQRLEAMRGAAVLHYRVKDVVRQVSVKLEVNGILICRYIMDFVVTYGDGRIEWVEVKGFETDVWKLKAALFRAIYPERNYVIVREVR